MRAFHWLAVLALALTVSCNSAAPPVDKAADEQAIRGLAVQWAAAVEKRDLDAVMAFYTSDATAAWPDAPAIHGTDAIRAGWAEVLKTPGLVLRFTPERVDIANNGDIAVDFGKIESEFDGPTGRVQDVAKYLVVWQKVDGQWKARYDTFNSNKPAAPPTAPPPAGS
jgi:ketosteroid isomerase-like protein